MFTEVKEFLDEWSNTDSHEDIIYDCEAFLDAADSEEEDEIEVNDRTFSTYDEDDVEFIESVMCEAIKRERTEKSGDMYFVDVDGYIHEMKRKAFCEKFGIDIPFLRFHRQGLSAPEGVATTFETLEDLHDARNGENEAHWHWDDKLRWYHQAQIGFVDIKETDTAGFNLHGAAGLNPYTGKWVIGFEFHAFDMNTRLDTELLIPRTFIIAEFPDANNLRVGNDDLCKSQEQLTEACRLWVRKHHPELADKLN